MKQTFIEYYLKIYRKQFKSTEIVFNETREPVDYLLLDVNRTAEKYMGLKQGRNCRKELKKSILILERNGLYDMVKP